MTVFDSIDGCLPQLSSNGRFLGLDVGEKTVGLSLSDEGQQIASPYETLKRKSFEKDIASVVSLINEYKAVAVVVGFPINMMGDIGPQAEWVRGFAEKLAEFVDIPVVLWDERLSTMAVTRTLLEADMSRAKRKKVVDKMAASFILQGALDYLSLKR